MNQGTNWANIFHLLVTFYYRGWQPVAYRLDLAHGVISSGLWTWGFDSIWWGEQAAAPGTFPLPLWGELETADLLPLLLGAKLLLPVATAIGS